MVTAFKISHHSLLRAHLHMCTQAHMYTLDSFLCFFLPLLLFRVLKCPQRKPPPSSQVTHVYKMCYIVVPISYGKKEVTLMRVEL